MFGTLRFLLAFAVLVSHSVPLPIPLHIGVAAVVVFYIISGYVITGLIQRHYNSFRRVFAFYIDRMMRIYPQYLFILVLTWIGIALGALHVHPALQHFSWGGSVANLTIIPLNYFMYFGDWTAAVIPPAWSLGAELQFYLLLPLILFLRLRALVLVISLAVFTLASFGFIPTNTHSYRLLSGVMFIFLMGSLLYDFQRGQEHLKRYIYLIYAFCAGLFVLLMAMGKLNVKANSNSVFVGILVGFPIFWYLSLKQRKAWDEYLGDLSYGLFLSHCTVLFLLNRWSFFRINWNSYDSLWLIGLALLLKLLLVFVGAFALSYVGFRWIESPVLRYRKEFRKKREQLKQARAE